MPTYSESDIGTIVTNLAKIYLTDSNGHYWLLGVDTLGNLTTSDQGTDAPTDGTIIDPA